MCIHLRRFYDYNNKKEEISGKQLVIAKTIIDSLPKLLKEEI